MQISMTSCLTGIFFISTSSPLPAIFASSPSALNPSAQNTEGEVRARELSEAVSRWLRSVSEEKRRVFVRRYWYAESLRQIADRYGMSEVKLKSLLWRARRELAKQLMKEGYLP